MKSAQAYQFSVEPASTLFIVIDVALLERLGRMAAGDSVFRDAFRDDAPGLMMAPSPIVTPPRMITESKPHVIFDRDHANVVLFGVVGDGVATVDIYDCP